MKKVQEQPKRDVKPAEPRRASPFENTAPARPTTSTAPATSKPTVSVPAGPRALTRNQPQYPARAQALRIEGRVKVKFDVTSDGRVDNVQIVSAQPANMFEREVKNAMRRWRYEAGKLWLRAGREYCLPPERHHANRVIEKYERKSLLSGGFLCCAPEAGGVYRPDLPRHR